MRTYTVYPSKDEWLAARDRTPGASTLGRWHAYHELTPPPDNEHVRNALTFGSLWEPYIAKQWALTNGYKTCPPNTHWDDIPDGALAWYDDSILADDQLGCHVSFDAIVRDRSGDLITVEIKTGSAPSFAFVDSRMRDAYRVQANVERIMAEAKECVIVYAQRPRDWMSLTPAYIEQWINEHMQTTDVTDPLFTEEDIRRLVEEITSTADTPSDDCTEGDALLAAYLGMKDKADGLKAELMEWMNAHPGVTPSSHGRRATLRTSLRRTTNWANLVKDHNLADFVEHYTTEKETTTLSITKEKQQ